MWLQHTLILAVKKLREYAEKQGLEDHLAGYLPRSVVGFDSASS